MNYSVDHIDDLIGKYLSGEAAPEEVQFVENWAGTNSTNQKYLEHCGLIFKNAVEAKGLQDFDADAAWEKMKVKFQHRKSPKVLLGEPKPSLGIFWRIAASIVIVLSAGYFGYEWLSTRSPKAVGIIAKQQTKADTLPDGSGVFLNKKTELTYSFDKKKKNHRVKLKGEAYFNIHHEDDKQFIVDADGVFIRDIGTSFNVKAYPDDNTVEVVVVEGKVMLYTDQDTGIYLSANGKGIYNKTTKTFTIEQPEENVLAYKTRFFSFNDTNLRAVVDALNKVYDKKIVIGKNLFNCHLTVSFNNEDIDEIAAIMAETLGLTVTNTPTGIGLEGLGCGN